MRTFLDESALRAGPIQTWGGFVPLLPPYQTSGRGEFDNVKPDVQAYPSTMSHARRHSSSCVGLSVPDSSNQ